MIKGFIERNAHYEGALDSGYTGANGETTAKSTSEKRGIGVQAKLLLVLIPVIIAVIAGIAISVQSAASKILLEKGNILLETHTESVAEAVSRWMDGVTGTLEFTRASIEYIAMTPEQELDYIRRTASLNSNFPDGLYFATTDGTLVHSSFVPDASFNALERGWYQSGISSDSFAFGSAYKDANTGLNVVGVSAVLHNADGGIRGVAAADIQLTAISEIVKQVNIEQTGGALLIDATTDMIIGHKEDALSGTLLSEHADEPLYAQLSQWIAARAYGLQTFPTEDGEILLDLQKLPGCEWVSVSYVPKAEILRDLNTLTARIAAIAVIAVVVLAALIFLLIRRIVIVTVKKLDNVARRIAQGDLTARLEHQSGDELGSLSANFGKTVERLQGYVAYINEITAVLDEIAHGNLDFTLNHEYVGEFSRIKTALEEISRSLNHTMSQINQASNQVFMGAEQLSGGAQTLSRGASEQAAAVEELSATIQELSAQIQGNATESRRVSGNVGTAADRMTQSNAHMQELMSAMEDINEHSGQIGRIMKTIDDIAFQTNILALNAAVEAARAGAAGKGFAVVADEVRNLASKSAEAAKGTAHLISASVEAVQRGSALAGETAKSLRSTTEDMHGVKQAVEQLAQVSDGQAHSIRQISQGVTQISQVVQTNSATSQETAASSEELSAQAEVLRKLVSDFRLKDSAFSTQ